MKLSQTADTKKVGLVWENFSTGHQPYLKFNKRLKQKNENKLFWEKNLYLNKLLPAAEQKFKITKDSFLHSHQLLGQAFAPPKPNMDLAPYHLYASSSCKLPMLSMSGQFQGFWKLGLHHYRLLQQADKSRKDKFS